MSESTFFAPAVRSSESELNANLEQMTNSTVLTTLLHSISGLLAIVNHNRELISVNEGFLHELGLTDISELLGARLGEALHCIHSHETPGGCGTTRFCSTCGAAMAIMKTLTEKIKAETLCALTVEKNGESKDTALKVTTTPFEIDNELFVLIFLQDVSREQEWQVLEQLFFHDFNNILGGIIGSAGLLKYDPTDSCSLEIIESLAWRMKREIDVQKVLFQKSVGSYELAKTEITVKKLFEELNNIIVSNKCATTKFMMYESIDESFMTDVTLLLRVLLNMTLNALESIAVRMKVVVACQSESNSLLFSVWSESVIPDELQKRVFQRYFSTKAFVGRGLGTYSIKLFGEQYLGGKVWFTSEIGKGTTFYLRLPKK